MNKRTLIWIIVLGSWFILMMAFSFATSSGLSEVEIDEPSFEILKSDEIFFRNLRLSSYNIVEDSASGFEILRHKNIPAEAPFQFRIIRNWKNRMAYITPVTADSISQIVIDNKVRELYNVDMRYNWETSILFFNLLRENADTLLQDPKLNQSIREYRKYHLETIRDFLRLTNKLP